MAPKRKPPTARPKPKIDAATKAAAQKSAIERARERIAAAKQAAEQSSKPTDSEIKRLKLADQYESEWWAMTDAEHVDIEVNEGRAAFLAMRRKAQIEKLRSMEGHDGMYDWAASMAVKHGDRIDVWDHTTLDGKLDEDLEHAEEAWLLAFAIMKYGEAPEHWPDAWSDADAARGSTWLDGQKPARFVRPAAQGRITDSEG